MYDQHKRFEFVITEAALRWSPTPGIMPAQLAKIEAVADMTNVWLGILPLTTPLGIMHSFYLYDEPIDAEPVVAIELPHGRITLDGPADVAAYRETFVRAKSLAADDVSRELARISGESGLHD